MQNQFEYKPQKKKPKGIAFAIAILGLFLLNIAATLIISGKGRRLGFALLVVGLALVVLAVLCGWDKSKLFS